MGKHSPIRSYSARLLTLLLAAGASAACAEEAPTVLRLQEYGGGMITHYSTFELKDDGVLELTRRGASGALIQRRRLETTPDDLRHYLDLLEEGRYFSGAAADIRSDRIEEVLADFKDSPPIRVEVFRDDVLIAATVVPPPIAARLRPELREISYVRTAWQLFAEFESRWEDAAKVEP